MNDTDAAEFCTGYLTGCDTEPELARRVLFLDTLLTPTQVDAAVAVWDRRYPVGQP